MPVGYMKSARNFPTFPKKFTLPTFPHETNKILKKSAHTTHLGLFFFQKIGDL